MSNTINDLAGEAYDAFTRVKRDDDEPILTLKDDAPEWVRSLVYAAHGEFLPDDWRYESIRSALGAIHDYCPADGLDDFAHEWADGNIDTYNGGRVAWLASNAQRALYCDDATAELGTPGSSILEMIAMGQYAESMEIYASVVQSLRNHIEDEIADEIADSPCDCSDWTHSRRAHD